MPKSYYPYSTNLNRLPVADRRKLLKFMRGSLSQRQLARALLISKSTVERWELGTALPHPDTLSKLLTHFVAWWVKEGKPKAFTMALKEAGIKNPLTTETPNGT